MSRKPSNEDEEEVIIFPIDKTDLWRKKLRPVINTVQLWGIQIDKSRQSIWSIIIFIFLHLQLLHMIGYTTTMMYYHEEFLFVAHNVIFIFGAIGTLATYYCLFSYREQLDDALSEAADHNFIKYGDYRITWRDHFRMTFFWLYCISYFSYSIWFFLMTEDLRPYYNKYIYGVDPNRLPAWLAFTLALFLQLVFALWTRVAEKLLCFFYGSICRYISAEFQSLKRSLEALPADWHLDPARQNLLMSMNRYVNLCDSVNTIDFTLSSVVFIWVGSLGVQITFNGNYICKAKDFCVDSIFCLQYFTEFLFTIIAFIDVFMSASSIHVSAQDIAPILYKIATSPDCRGRDHLRSRIGLWYWRVITDAPKLCGFGTFTLSRGCLLNILGIIVTYIVIMYELA